MARVTVKLFAHLREQAGKAKLEIHGSDLREVLDILVKENEGLRELIFSGERFHPFIHVLVNGISVKDKDGLNTRLSTGDEIALFPPVSGG